MHYNIIRFLLQIKEYESDFWLLKNYEVIIKLEIQRNRAKSVFLFNVVEHLLNLEIMVLVSSFWNKLEKIGVRIDKI